MAKRKKSAKRRPTIASKFGISQRQYNSLRDESAKARRRIKDFAKRDDAGAYFIPDSNDYLLDSLLNRVQQGEKVSSIVKEVKGITSKKIQSGTPLNVQTMNEYSLSPSEKRRVTAAVKKANENIRQARKDFDFALDILPEEFDAKKFVENIGSKESLSAHLKGLDLFTPENLVPTAVNDLGEAGTKAEYEYYTMILERENQRRARIREITTPNEQTQYIVQQSDYDKRNIDLSKIVGREERKNRAETWDDAKRVYRANLFLTNYRDSLKLTEAVMRTNGLMNDTIKERFDFIYDVINKTFNNEDAITHLIYFMPTIDISIISGGVSLGAETFNTIYNEWSEFDNMWF